MSAKEANMLDELRNKELRALTDSEYKTIRDEVESKGIRALRGSSAQIVFAALRKRNESMQKATGVRVGDMVSWDSSGGTARGKVEHIMREGVLGIPKSKFSIKAEKDDPAVLIRIYRNDEETDTLVGHKMSTLKKSSKVEKHGTHDQQSHDPTKGGGSGEKGLDAFQQKMLQRGMAAWEKHDYKTMMADYDKMEAKWRKKLDKPYDPENEEYGDPAELADTDFFKKYGAYPIEVTMFYEAATAQGYVKKNSKVEKHGNHDQKSHGRWAKDDSEGEFADTEGLHPAHRWSKDDSEGEYADTEWQDIAAMDEMDLRNPPKSEAYYNARTGKTTVGKWILEEEKITNTYIQRGLSSSDARKQARADMESKYKTNINELARAHPEQIPELR